MRPSPHAAPAVVAVRAAVATAEIVAFSAVAHQQADGRLPVPDQMLWLTLAVYAGAVLALTGRVRVRTVVCGSTALQAGLHVAYALLAPPAMAHHHGASMPMPMPATHVVPDTGMLLAHLVSAVVTALVLLAQEQALRELGRAVDVRPSVVPVLLLTAPIRLAEPGRSLDLVGLAPRRGPPALLSPTTS